MSLPEDIIDNLTGYSKAMYATWFFYRPARLLLDAGEGVAPTLGNGVFGIERIFISHGHYDHVGGLAGIIHARASGMGETGKALAIYHPKGDRLVEEHRKYILRTSGQLPYELTWHPLEPGEVIKLPERKASWKVKCFATRHRIQGMTLGYRLMESRRRLRSALQGATDREIRETIRRDGRDAVSETYDHILLAYSGDSRAVETGKVRSAEVLMHDATFLSAEDRDTESHASLTEALDVAQEAGVGGLVLFHVSSRYPRSQVREALTSEVSSRGLGHPVCVQLLRKLIRIQ